MHVGDNTVPHRHWVCAASTPVRLARDIPASLKQLIFGTTYLYYEESELFPNRISKRLPREMAGNFLEGNFAGNKVLAQVSRRVFARI